MRKGITNDMFKQLEEISIKLDKSLNEINEQSLIIYELRLEIKRYEEESKKDKELIKKLIEENEKLKNHNNKNSNNSSKPTSTNTVTPKKKKVPIYITIALKLVIVKAVNTITKDII